MAEFKALNPKATVIGQAIMGVSMALGERAVPILQKYGLGTIDPAAWYPQQAWLDVLREVDQGDMFDLVAIGKQVSSLVPLPGEINSVESALLMLTKTYDHNNRNCPGTSSATLTGERQIQIDICDPYPRNMVYGVIYGFAARFEPQAIVRYLNNVPPPSASDCCTYIVTW
ncbi:MAG: hypothetical protein J0M07_04195 [Anaerolineae bacterium]|uniref:hypothetical protein n=1 Tax=Candidatus Flexifilum breve TaxID=3140694 RepID=UPI001ACF260E|nr:hypothetical protein [Chloroflexota bacterium]MBK9748581.1 hypothetical protein [Chloroflexota bacterium]MBN8634500.1 hypothetical protein [Anaerolineae bacterium]